MSYRVRVLCRPPLAAGFRLAGLTPIEAQDPEEGGRRLAREPLPLVVPFPGPAWGPPREGAEAYIAELLRRAIGYRVRLG